MRKTWFEQAGVVRYCSYCNKKLRYPQVIRNYCNEMCKKANYKLKRKLYDAKRAKINNSG